MLLTIGVYFLNNSLGDELKYSGPDKDKMSALDIMRAPRRLKPGNEPNVTSKNRR